MLSISSSKPRSDNWLIFVSSGKKKYSLEIHFWKNTRNLVIWRSITLWFTLLEVGLIKKCARGYSQNTLPVRRNRTPIRRPKLDGKFLGLLGIFPEISGFFWENFADFSEILENFRLKSLLTTGFSEKLGFSDCVIPPIPPRVGIPCTCLR